MKKKLISLLGGLILFLIIAPVVVFGASPLDGENIEWEYIPLYYSGVQLEQKGLRVYDKTTIDEYKELADVYVPIRTFAEIKKNCTIHWDEDKSMVTMVMTDSYDGIVSLGISEFVIGSNKKTMIFAHPYWYSNEVWDLSYEVFLHEGSAMVSYYEGEFLIGGAPDADNARNYFRNQLDYSDAEQRYGRKSQRFYDDYGVDSNNWITMKDLSLAQIKTENGEWNLSLVDNKDATLNHLLGDNFKLLYAAKENMQMSCNGIEIKKINNSYFLSKSDLIRLGLLEAE